AVWTPAHRLLRIARDIDGIPKRLSGNTHGRVGLARARFDDSGGWCPGEAPEAVARAAECYGRRAVRGHVSQLAVVRLGGQHGKAVAGYDEHLAVTGLGTRHHQVTPVGVHESAATAHRALSHAEVLHAVNRPAHNMTCAAAEGNLAIGGDAVGGAAVILVHRWEKHHAGPAPANGLSGSYGRSAIPDDRVSVGADGEGLGGSAAGIHAQIPELTVRVACGP